MEIIHVALQSVNLKYRRQCPAIFIAVETEVLFTGRKGRLIKILFTRTLRRLFQNSSKGWAESPSFCAKASLCFPDPTSSSCPVLPGCCPCLSSVYQFPYVLSLSVRCQNFLWVYTLSASVSPSLLFDEVSRCRLPLL